VQNCIGYDTIFILPNAAAVRDPLAGRAVKSAPSRGHAVPQRGDSPMTGRGFGLSTTIDALTAKAEHICDCCA
jgi:hypothetical protein